MSKNKGGNKPSSGGNKPSSGGGSGGQASGGGIKVAGVNVGQAFNVGDIAKIQAAKPNISIEALQQKAKAADVKIKPGAKAFFNAQQQQVQDLKEQETKDKIESILEEFGITPGGQTVSPPGEEIVPISTFDLAKEGANLEVQRQIEKIRQDAMTERTKYEVDNKIPLVQAESKGKIDLQKIVNSGYKNIANIERGTEMVRNITSMFNF